MDSVDSNISVVLVYHCWLCTTEFNDKLGILQHLKAQHGDRQELQDIEKKMKVPICITCGSVDPCEHKMNDYNHVDDTFEEEFEDDNLEEDNFSKAPRPRSIPCATCGETFSDAICLREHRRQEHPLDKSYQCTFCTSTFVKHSHLVVHIRIHTGSRPYICEECGNRFPKSSDLKRHSRVHSGEKPYKCALCSQTFTQKCSLEKHARIHARRMGGHPCLMCGLVFNEVDNLIEHTQITHQEVSWRCTTCGKMFAEERHLLLHEKSHLTVKSFSCAFCPRNFSTHLLLAKHEETIHASKKEIKCEECGKEFKRRENLARHLLSHSGVKNHKCPTCGMMFTEKGSLTRHTKSQHDLLRPHVCMICARAFTRKILLRKHMDRLHSNKDGSSKMQKVIYFRCKLCKKLLRKSGYTHHMKFHRTKGDIWEGNLEENDPDEHLDDLEMKQELTDYDEFDGKDESEGEKVKEEISQWDSDSTIENSDTEIEKVGRSRSQFHVDSGLDWSNFPESGGSLQYVQGKSYEIGSSQRIEDEVFQRSLAFFAEGSFGQKRSLEDNLKGAGCQTYLDNPVLQDLDRLNMAGQIAVQNVYRDGMGSTEEYVDRLALAKEGI